MMKNQLLSMTKWSKAPNQHQAESKGDKVEAVKDWITFSSTYIIHIGIMRLSIYRVHV